MILGGTAGIAFIVFLKQQGRIQIPTHLQQNWTDFSGLCRHVYVRTAEAKIPVLLITNPENQTPAAGWRSIAYIVLQQLQDAFFTLNINKQRGSRRRGGLPGCEGSSVPQTRGSPAERKRALEPSVAVGLGCLPSRFLKTGCFIVWR